MCDARATATVFVKLDQMLAEIPDVWRTCHIYRIGEDGPFAVTVSVNLISWPDAWVSP